MGEPKGAARKALLLALVVGAGVCYWAYRATSGGRRRSGAGGGGGAGGAAATGAPGQSGPRVSAHPQAGGPESGSRQQQQQQQHVEAAAAAPGIDRPKSHHGLEAHHVQKLIRFLEITEDPIIQEQILIALSNSAAFSVNQDIIRNLGGLSVIGEMLSSRVAKVKEKALNALNNLSMNAKNQEELKMYVTKVCEETDSSPLNSEVQLAGLRFLTNMSVTNDNHFLMISSIPCFLHLLSQGNERTQIQVLKVLVNLSANPAMMEHLLDTQAPFLLCLFDSCVTKGVLLRALVFATNLTEHMKKEDNTSAVRHQHSEGSIFSVLWGSSTQYAQKLALLLQHHDGEIREQVAKLIMQM